MASNDEPTVLLPVQAERIDPCVTDDEDTFGYFEAGPRGEAAAVRLAGFQRVDETLYDLSSTAFGPHASDDPRHEKPWLSRHYSPVAVVRLGIFVSGAGCAVP